MSSTVDKSEQRVREMFGEISPRYDFLNHFLSGGTDYYWRWRTVRTVAPEGDEPILDVCTGTGDLAISYWNKSQQTTEVVGTDFTHNMLHLANGKKAKQLQKSSAAEPAALQFLEADTQELPFESNQFQIVSVAFGLRNVTDTKRGLNEMIRVCIPGGRVAVLEFSLPKNRILKALYLFYFKNILPKIGQLLARNKQSAYNYLPESVHQFPYGQQLADIMESCGLEQVKWKQLTFGIATLYYGRKPK